ncbi:hypothetical protein, partial [Pseudomonas sp. FW305-BF6]|uniref:hypothetical protein n=1 Tax=Pseudomonas sp. FW305-BF6 TaxID=2070673 RepID=UPI001C49388E
VENFNIYVGMNRASQKLIITYPLTSDDGKVLAPSSIVQRMKSLFPTIRTRFESGELSFITAEEQLSFVTNTETAISNLVSQIQS